MVCLLYLGVHDRSLGEGRKRERVSIEHSAIEATIQCSGSHIQKWLEDESEMLGIHLCWRYRFGSPGLMRKIKIIVMDMKTICGMKTPRSEFWEASEFLRTVPEKLVDDILENRWRGVGGGSSEENSSTASGPCDIWGQVL